MDLRKFAVTLIGIELNPQLVNPVTLRLNDIVDESWKSNRGAKIGITESNLGYANGVEVEASDETLRFCHSASSFETGEVLSAILAKRFIDVFGVDDWWAIRFDFGGQINAEVLAMKPEMGVQSLADHLTIGNVVPSCNFTTHFQFPDKSLNVQLSHDAAADNSHVSCLGSVFHCTEEYIDAEGNNKIGPWLANWKSDWQEVAQAVIRLHKVVGKPVGG